MTPSDEHANNVIDAAHVDADDIIKAAHVLIRAVRADLSCGFAVGITNGAELTLQVDEPEGVETWIIAIEHVA